MPLFYSQRYRLCLTLKISTIEQRVILFGRWTVTYLLRGFVPGECRYYLGGWLWRCESQAAQTSTLSVTKCRKSGYANLVVLCMPPGLRHAATTNGKESSVKPIAIFVRSLQNIIKERVVFRNVYQLLVYTDKSKVAGESWRMRLGTSWYVVTKNGSVSERPKRAANQNSETSIHLKEFGSGVTNIKSF